MVKKCSFLDVPIIITSHNVGEKRVLVDSNSTPTNITQIAVTSLKQGEIAESHVHQTMEEYFLIRRGEAEIIVDNEVFICKTDDFIQIPPKSTHRLRAITDVELLTIGCAI